MADTKDWTWVLDRACPECGYDAGSVAREDLGARVRENAARWEPVLARDSARERPAADVWSPTEYACHVRDVHRTFVERLGLMLGQDDPQFANWDQDATALEAGYASADPGAVGAELLAAAEEVAAVYDGVAPEAWGRRGFRSDGAEFTIESIGRYHLHDVVHHVWDVRG